MSNDIKVFCVGGHKNGTYSLHNYFLNHNLDSVHGQFWMNKGFDFINLHSCFSDHFAEWNSLLCIKYKPHSIIHLLDKYPNSLFILNYRDLDGYIKSVCKHLSIGLLTDREWRWKKKTNENIPGTENIKSVVRRIINTHISNQFILDHFQKHKLMDRLLVLKITEDKHMNTKLLDNFLKEVITSKKVLFENIKHNTYISEDITIKANKIANEKYNSVKKIIKINNKHYSSKLDEIYNSYICTTKNADSFNSLSKKKCIFIYYIK